jgi:Na+-transporting methylmalonyl-CoA/oxaloacetate decarboxylase gamma subunit
VSLGDALVITALGMGVVFIGLILTALLITAFGVLSRIEEKRAAMPDEPVGPAPPVATGPVDDAVLAVISTVIDVERRLRHAEVTGRLTIVRADETRRIP